VGVDDGVDALAAEVVDEALDQVQVLVVVLALVHLHGLPEDA
jgi:hypothetical protein